MTSYTKNPNAKIVNPVTKSLGRTRPPASLRVKTSIKAGTTIKSATGGAGAGKLCY
jgi:hypothetical protein